MKNTKFKPWLLGGKLAATLAVLSTMMLITPEAQATPAFARQTGAACQKCHSASFPRLNWTGEKFMRNGFALAKSVEALDVGFPDEAAAAKETEKHDDMLLIQDVGEILSVRGKIKVYDQPDTDSAEKSVGSPDFFAIFASAQLAPDVPLWAEAEINTATGEAEVHNYFVGLTNVYGTSAVNLRTGGFTPTEWTSVNDQKRSIDSASSHPGAYRGKAGFTQVGNGLGTKTGIEYYGYNDSFLWAVGAGDDSGGNFHNSKPSNGMEYWLVGRFDFWKGSSVSILHMNYNVDNGSGSDLTSDTLSANWRINRDAELRAQYSMDNSGAGAVDDVTGYTLQGDWTFRPAWTGIVRYDTTDNGAASDATETQAQLALAWTHWQNVKMTAAYVTEIDRAEKFDKDTGASLGTDTADSLTLQLQFAM